MTTKAPTRKRATAAAARQVAGGGAAAGNANVATIVAIMGASGSGKTYTLRGKLAKLPARLQRRTIIWSPKEPADRYVDLYPGSKVVRSAAEVLRIVQAAGPSGEFHIVFWPRLVRSVDAAQFDAVCKIAMAARNVTMVADELHTVTMASWSPDGWSQLVMMGRAYGCAVFGLSQRPANMDKDFLGNCTVVRTARLSYEADCTALAKALRVPVSQVAGLTGYQWIERDMQTGQVATG